MFPAFPTSVETTYFVSCCVTNWDGIVSGADKTLPLPLVQFAVRLPKPFPMAKNLDRVDNYPDCYLLFLTPWSWEFNTTVFLDNLLKLNLTADQS